MWSGETFSTAAATVRSECVVSSWKLDSSSTYRSGVARCSRSSAGSPRLAPATAACPAAVASSAISAVTVLLPLVPVTAATGARGLAREELDVADDRQSAPRRLDRDRLPQREPGRDDAPATRRRAAPARTGRCEPRSRPVRGAGPRSPGGSARVSATRSREALAMQVARGREPGAAEAEHQCPGARLERRDVVRLRVHRSFSVASPISTRITVMIQKRTITFGSAQPLSS